MEGKNKQQYGGQNKTGHGHQRGGNDLDDLIQQFSPLKGGHGTQNDAENQGDDPGGQADSGGIGKAADNEINDRIAHPAGGEAEVAMEDVPQVVHKLNRNRFVKPVFGLQRGDNCITFGFFRTERACRNGMHDKKGDGDDQKDGQQCHQEPFQQVCKKLIVHLYAPQVPFAKNFLLIILGRQQFVKPEFSVLPQ